MRRAAAAVVVVATALLAGSSSAANAPRPRIVVKPIPLSPARLAETRAYAQRHYGVDTWRLRHPHVIVEHYTASDTFASAYATFASERFEPRRGARRLRALRHRPRRDDLPARAAEHHLPSYGRAQLHGDRHRARRHERRADPRGQAPARRVAAADALVDEPLRHPAAKRHRPQREPDEPVPPGAQPGVAVPDARRLDAQRHAGLPSGPRAAGAPLRRAAGASGPARRFRLLSLS